MKISTTTVKGVKSHTYNVNAYTSGYGQGAVGKLDIKATDSHKIDNGATVYVEPTKMDKYSEDYSSTYTFPQTDHSMTYSSPSHKVAFDVQNQPISEFTEASRDGVEAGYHGSAWSCIDKPDLINPVANFPKIALVFKNDLAISSEAMSIGTFKYDAAVVGEPWEHRFGPAPTGKRLTPIAGECKMYNAAGTTATELPSSGWAYAYSTQTGTYMTRLQIGNVTGDIVIKLELTDPPATT